ncbi:MAG: AMP-binding protein, partial [Pseudomonadota bacterium]
MKQAHMMDFELSVTSLIDHAERFHGKTKITSVPVVGGAETTTWAEVARNARRIARWLDHQGLATGARVGTLAWNTRRHLELYFGVPGAGCVCHTLNPRLHDDQLAFILNEAEDEILFFDIDQADRLAAVQARLTSVRTFVALSRQNPEIASKIDGVVFYDDLIAATVDDFSWIKLDERAPAFLCYTSGTTGRPKGVVYTHRSTVLHTLACNQPDGMGLSAADCLLMVVPMFHVNAWGSPFMAACVGAELALPGPRLDGESLIDLINRTATTHALGVPTIWLGLLEALNRTGQKIDSLTRSIVGGAALPPSLIAEFRDRYDVHLIHGWGMTEMSPIGTINRPLAFHRNKSPEDRSCLAEAQGRPPFGMDMRLVGEDGEILPNDGQSKGVLQVRGPWVVDHYFKTAESALTTDGWFDTGDISSIDPDGYMRIHDRAKDIIKSGGEWISTVELENIAIAHPSITNAAAIAAAHKKWGERPVLVVVRSADVKNGGPVSIDHAFR